MPLGAARSQPRQPARLHGAVRSVLGRAAGRLRLPARGHPPRHRRPAGRRRRYLAHISPISPPHFPYISRSWEQASPPPPYLPYTSPISPLYLPYISRSWAQASRASLVTSPPPSAPWRTAGAPRQLKSQEERVFVGRCSVTVLSCGEQLLWNADTSARARARALFR